MSLPATGWRSSSHNRVEFLDLFFAAGKGACVLVPLGTRLTAHEIAPILADSGARLVVYDGEFATLVESLRALPEAAAVETWVALDSPLAGGDRRFAELVSARTLPVSFRRGALPRTSTACSTPRAPPAARRA